MLLNLDDSFLKPVNGLRLNPEANLKGGNPENLSKSDYDFCKY